MDGLILAVDLGKFNSVCCWYDTATKAATFRSAKTTRTGATGAKKRIVPMQRYGGCEFSRRLNKNTGDSIRIHPLYLFVFTSHGSHEKCLPPFNDR